MNERHSSQTGHGCFLRWAGGKRWLSEHLSDYINCYEFNRYFEPFLGGGSTFFSLRPKKSVLSDCNGELINTYVQVKLDYIGVERSLRKLPNTEDSYKQIRESIPLSEIERAARFIYLNRTCFNGLYRINQRGQFNVPYGGGDRGYESLLTNQVLGIASKALQKSRIVCQDFESSLQKSGTGDIVYCDPAYTVAHNSNGFVRYNEKVFSWNDQCRLRDSAFSAASRGAIILVSNAAHESLMKLYHPFKPFTLTRGCTVGGKVGRGHFNEYLFLLGAQKSDRRFLGTVLAKSGHL